jgi:signal transduction histidine kinase
MLRTMNFRTKLLGILAVPMIGLLAVTTVAVSDRRAQADESARVRDRIDVVAAAQAMAQQVRIEEGLSGKEVASGDRTVTTEQRAVTDTAIRGFKDALANASGVGSNAYDQALARLDTNLKALATYRSSVNLGTDASFFLTGYKNILNNISTLVSTIADETNDPQLSRQTAALAALARASDATASEWAVLQVSFTRGVMAVTESSELKATVTDRARWLGVYEGLANANGLADVRNQTVGDDVQRADAYERRALAVADDPTLHLDGDAAVWEAAMRGRLTGLSDAATHQIAAIDDQAVTIHNIAVDSLRRFLLLAGSAILLSVGLGLLLARAVTQPLGKLTAAAQKLANVQLPRRNQVLIDRQIEFLDELEAAEDDPDQLGQLYRLDHLATRMRRNAESLLVLAGLEPARKRTRPVALVDVVRAAIGEVEDYARVDLAGFDEVEVTGNAAVDLGHLLAELLENATNFSPPASRVEVDGRATRNGYVVTIIDKGIGMNEEQLAEANVLLASPAPVGLALTRSLGFTVIGRLAARFGVGVRLMASPAGGIAAVVHLPMHLVVDADAPADTSPAAAPEPDLRLVPTMPEPEPEPARAPDVWELEWPDESLEVQPFEVQPFEVQQPVAAVPSPFETPATTFGEAVPQGAQFERGLNDLLSGDDVLGAPVLIEPAVTSSGLLRRVPKRAALDEDQVRPVAESPHPAIAAGRRSPDDVRAMLARYRTGLQRGRTSDALGTNEEDPA